MEEEARPPRTRSPALVASGVLFGLYVAYVIVAAFAQKAQATLPLRLGDIGESVLFLAASIAFVAGFLQLDRKRDRTGTLWQAIDENAERYAMLVLYVFVCAVIVQGLMSRISKSTPSRPIARRTIRSHSDTVKGSFGSASGSSGCMKTHVRSTSWATNAPLHSGSSVQ